MRTSYLLLQTWLHYEHNTIIYLTKSNSFATAQS